MKGRIVIRFIILVTLMFFVGGILMVINGLHQLDKLFSAIESNDYIMAQAAIDDGAWVNCRKHLLYAPNLIPTNPTPLIMACKKGNVEIVKLLLKNGADINKKDNFTDQTPLLAALHGEKQNRFSLAMYLIENGADIHAVQEGVSSPLYKALYISESDGQQTILEGTLLVEYLLKNNVDQRIYMSGENALTFSAHYRNGFAVRYLIENQHYDVNSYDSDGNTALIVATKNEQQAIVEILIELGADASIRDANEKTALDYAVENNYDAIISILNDID